MPLMLAGDRCEEPFVLDQLRFRTEGRCYGIPAGLSTLGEEHNTVLDEQTSIVRNVKEESLIPHHEKEICSTDSTNGTG